jgi:hypothetical protein
MTPSFLSLPGRSLVARTIPYKSHQLHQGLGGEQNSVCPLRCVSGERNGHGEISPVPREGVQDAALTAYEHPGSVLAPEHVANASRLSGDATLLRQNGGLCSLKCNIGCGVFWG